MNRRSLVCVALLSLGAPLFIQSCAKPENLFETFRLKKSEFGIEDARQAIDAVNILLVKDGLAPYYLYEGKHRGNGVGLLWVGDKTLSQSVTDMLFVPNDCRCVIAQPKVYYSWIKNCSTVGGTDYSNNDESVRLLSYLLLHEYGHIIANHPGRALSENSAAFNSTTNANKSKEQIADDFASGIVSRYDADKNNFDTWIPAANINMAISSFAFTLQGKRVVDNFACSILDAPCAFHDMGDTHFNLEYRILKAQCLISGEEYCEPLEDYEARRNSGGVFKGGVLYSKDTKEQSTEGGALPKQLADGTQG